MPYSHLSPEEFLDTVLIPEKQSDHICWQCRSLKPVLKGSKFPPADIIGWCKKNPLASLLVRSRFQRGEEVLRL